MYAAPPSTDSRVFVRIPERFRVQGRSNRWIDVQRHGAPTDCLLEGPSFDRDGHLFVVDVARGRIFRIAPDGEVELFVNQNAQPFRWTATADSILEKLPRLCSRISETAHY